MTWTPPRRKRGASFKAAPPRRLSLIATCPRCNLVLERDFDAPPSANELNAARAELMAGHECIEPAQKTRGRKAKGAKA